jgi:hypothetical protein
MMTPAMGEGEPGWKQWLVAYENAKTKEDREVAGLLALMRFPSAGREEGFVGYSVLRDNWWCGGWVRRRIGQTVTRPATTSGAEIISSPEASERIATFVTPAMASEAKQEQAAMRRSTLVRGRWHG